MGSHCAPAPIIMRIAKSSAYCAVSAMTSFSISRMSYSSGVDYSCQQASTRVHLGATMVVWSNCKALVKDMFFHLLWKHSEAVLSEMTHEHFAFSDPGG